MKKKYLITGFLTILILSIVFILKGIFPFGAKSIIWSDMHEQVTAIYYHFYDAIKNGSSLLVDYTSGGGINFLGVIAYYILSPFSLILLFFPRDIVYNAVSIVVALKIVASSLTSLYFIDKYFKNIKDELKILLSILYAFSGYTLSLYVITTWMDTVYLLPLFLVGLKELLDLENCKKYIIVLSMLLIFSFYTSFMLLIFVIFSSFIYLYIYKKDNLKKAIFNLGISTIISLLISSVILLPTALQIFKSQRVGFDIDYIANSKLGPFSDKVSYLFLSAPFIALIFITLYKYKKHKKFSLFIMLNILLVGLGILVEPINKLWHLGSYVYFPYRYGFILIMLLLIGAAYTLNNVNLNKRKLKDNKIIPVLLLIITTIVTTFIILKYKTPIEEAINHLTFTRDKKAIILLFIIFTLNLLTSISIIYTHFENKKIMAFLLYILVIPNIIFNTYLYVYPKDEKILKEQYEIMNDIYKDKGVTNYYLKDKDKILISNYGMVTSTNTYSSFTSLTEKNNFLTMQRLGYDSFWMDTRSLGGNLFTDILLAQKYVLTNKKIDDSYYELLKEEGNLKYYNFKYKMPYGFIIKESKSLENTKNSFEASNIIYNSIKEGAIFEIEEIYENDEKNIEKGKTFEKTINIQDKRKVYLEVFTDLENSEKAKSYKSFDIYVNGNLFYENFPDDQRNGTLYLGEYENEKIDIKIISKKKSVLRNITVGLLDTNKIDKLLEDYKLSDTIVSFHKNNINIKVTGNDGDLLMLPLTYLDGMNSDYEITRVFDNFIGIKLKSGDNNINISYTPKGLKLGLILTLIGIILYFVWTKILCNINIPILNNITFTTYIIIYALLIVVFYIIMPLLFIKSFI